VTTRVVHAGVETFFSRATLFAGAGRTAASIAQTEPSDFIANEPATGK